MTDKRSDPPEAEQPLTLSLSETVDSAIRRISTAIMVAGAIVGIAVYARPGPPRFEAVVDGDRIVRVDTRKGTIISCEGQQTCQLILRRGQRVTRVKRTDAPSQPKALPAPASAPAAPAATPPAAAPAAGR